MLKIVVRNRYQMHATKYISTTASEVLEMSVAFLISSGSWTA